MATTPFDEARAPGRGAIERGGPRIPPRALRAYDIRGLVGRDIDEGGARALGLSLAAWAEARGLTRFVVGRDGRLSSPVLERALVAGLCAGGAEVARIGLGPTPRVAFAARELGFDGGVMVTASHNPAGQNGFKLMIGAGRIHGDALHQLVKTPGRPRGGGYVRDVAVGAAYASNLVAAAGEPRPLRIAWDPGHGATAETVRRLTRRLPGGHVLINAEADGRFPVHHPDPSLAANLTWLQAAVREANCDLGLAFDGDGDRLGVVDAEGEIVWADQCLLFLARDLLAKRPGAAVVADVKCSRVLFDGVRRLGGRPVPTPSGYVPVRSAMQAAGAPLAGELSGHIFFEDCWDGADDALYAAMRLIRVLSERGGSLAEFRRSLPPVFATPELRIPCADETRAGIVAEAARQAAADGLDADFTDGVRVTTETGWWLLRAAGSEPMLTLRCEADDPESLDALKRDLAERLERLGVLADWAEESRATRRWSVDCDAARPGI
jgi:phosphomannomutase